MGRTGFLRHERFPGIGMRTTRLRRDRMAERKGCPPLSQEGTLCFNVLTGDYVCISLTLYLNGNGTLYIPDGASSQ